MQLVLRLWPHDEDASIVNSDSEKHDVKKEVPHGISNVESDRETLSNGRKILHMRVGKGQIIQWDGAAA